MHWASSRDLIRTSKDWNVDSNENSTESKEHLDFTQFYVAWDKKEDGNWNIKKFQPFKFSVNKLRTRMMRQSMRAWVEELSAKFVPDAYKNKPEDPYFVARIDKQKIRDFLHPTDLPTHTLKYALPDLCLEKYLLEKDPQE